MYAHSSQDLRIRGEADQTQTLRKGEAAPYKKVHLESAEDACSLVTTGEVVLQVHGKIPEDRGKWQPGSPLNVKTLVQ